MNRKKLLLNDRVEVRQLEEGLQGSWYSGKVFGVSHLCRSIQYDELLSETEDSKLIEHIPVTDAIEGLVSRRHVSPTYRGRIRPLPPSNNANACKSKLPFGICVDAWFEDAWWEGVVFDYNDDSNERSVFFPEEGDEHKFRLNHLRISHEWDEFNDVWKERGVWTLVELATEFGGDLSSSDFLKKVWFHLKNTYGFSKMVSEWTCGAKTLWKKHFRESVHDLTVNSRKHSCARNKHLPSKVTKNVNTKIKKVIPTQTSGCKTKGILNTSAVQSKVASSSVVRRKSALTHKQDIYNQTDQTEPIPADWLLSRMRNLRVQIPTSPADSGDEADNYPGNGSQTPHTEICGNIQSHTQNRESVIMQNNLSLVPPGHCRRPRSRKIPLSAKSRKKCSTMRKIVLVSQDNHESSKQDNLLLKEQEKELDCTTEDNIAQHVKSKHSSNGQDGNCPSTSYCPSSNFQKVRNNVVLNFKAPFSRKRKRGCRGRRPVDTICNTCHDNGDLIICARCHSSYHLSCIDLKNVPDEMWCCPACFCGLCGLVGSMTDNPCFLNICLQCSQEYHVNCLKKTGGAGSQFPIFSSSGTLCSDTCYKIYAYLHQLLGSSNPTGIDGVTWTMLKSTKEEPNIPGVARVNTCKKLSRALAVIHECFEPSIEPHTKRDLAKDIVYSSMSKLRRLNFQGFYVMALEKDDHIVSVATVRIHGLKVAEMPLIATHFKYRRQGMCRLLVLELEKLLSRLSVERLVLPAISQLRETWETAFGFQEMSHSERMKLLGYPFLGFHKTSMFQKYLISPGTTDETAASGKIQKRTFSAVEEHRHGRGLNGRHCNIPCKGKQYRNGILNNKCQDIQTFKNVYRQRRVLASVESRTS